MTIGSFGPNLDDTYDRETRRRKRNPTNMPTGNGGLIHTGPNGILAQLERASGRRPILDEYDLEIQRRERDEDERVARAKIDRDFPEPVKRAGIPAQDNQKGLFRALLAQLRTHNPKVWAQARDWFEGTDGRPGVVHTITKAEISPAITRLRGYLAAPASTGPVPVVETMERHDFADDAPVRRAGAAAWQQWRDLAAKLVEFGGPTGARFAVDTDPGAENAIAFWWIVPDDRTGRYYLRQVIGGQGPVKVRMSPEAMIAIAKKIIAAGPKEAMLRFGREIGSCGHCGRTLTNDESRAYGIGPVCRKGKGW